jgi:primary-amine oxidase
MTTTVTRAWLRPTLVCLVAGAVALPVVLVASRGRAPSQAAEPAPAHPLDPLTTAEIDRAADILKRERNLPDDVLFPALTLNEPPKGQVLAGKSVPREAFAVVFNHKTNKTSEAVVDLTAGHVTRFEEVSGVQPRILFAEFDPVTDLVRANPQVQEALRKRGIKDLDKVYVELWAGGPAEFGGPEKARLGRALCYDRPEGGTGYLRPVAGLVVFLDLNARKVLRVVDSGHVPVAHNPDNFFDPRQAGPPREAPRPVDVVQPRGRSFTVDGHAVRWQNWSFRFADTQREGLVLYQVTYHDHGKARPVLYRGSLAELVVPYGDADEAWSWRAPFDEGEYGLGILSTPLERGQQVPYNAVLFETVFADDHGKAYTSPNSVALYERDGGVLWTHTEGEPVRTECRRAQELVLTSIMAAGNYDYGFNWMFTQDGSIRVEVELGGIPLAKGVATTVCERCAAASGKAAGGDEDRYGTVVAPHIVTPNHQHWFCFRLDMDVDGPANTVSELNARHQGDEKSVAWVVDETVLESEQKAQRDINPATGRHWKVFNRGTPTGLGHFPGYALEPAGNSLPLTGPRSELRQRAKFLDHHLWVTRYKEGELYAAGDYPNQSTHDDGLPHYASDDEKLAGEDVVLWYSCGVTHAPRPEDWPVMPTVRTGFRLVPHGFFTRNPALDVPAPRQAP